MESWTEKPEGGYVLIPAMHLLRAWWAYRSGNVRLLDLRVWLASFELVARRCGFAKGRIARYRERELTLLVGSTADEHMRASIRRLEAASLLVWSGGHVKPLGGVASEDDEDGLGAVVSLVANTRRRVPVPRRLLRFLSLSRKPVLIATVLGHLLRCVYSRRGGVRSDGFVKAGWIADVFGVDERNVKAARSWMVSASLFSLRTAPQRILNRYGVPGSVNVHWKDEARACRPPPLSCLSTTESPPPRRTGISSSGRSWNQKPANPCGPDGVRMKKAARTSFHVPLGALQRHQALAALQLEARRLGLLSGSEADGVRFFAAACRARRCATRNPEGFFAALIRKRQWHLLSGLDEAAGQRLQLRDRVGECRPKELGDIRVAALVSRLASRLGGTRSVTAAESAAGC